jgi:hypothetical protein
VLRPVQATFVNCPLILQPPVNSSSLSFLTLRDIFDSFGGYRWTIQIPDNYLLVEITTMGGDHVSGSRLNEDAFSIQIRDQQGRIRSYLKAELAELNKRWGKSPMPSYKNVLTAEELDDIVAYLASLRGLR